MNENENQEIAYSTIGDSSNNEVAYPTIGGDSSDNKNFSIEKIRKNVIKISPFTKFCMSYGMIPTSYKIAMTYEEQLLWLCDFIENTVIPSVNADSEAIEELQNLYNQLSNYLTSEEFKKTIQEELDKMIEDGTLENILKQYVDPKFNDLEEKIGKLNVPTEIDPETGEPTDQPLSEALELNPQRLINPEYFNRFKNMVDNSSFEVFDGNTMIPYGWDNGVVTEDASMFNSHSLQINAGETVKQTQNAYIDVDWVKGAYDTEDIILCFYHKWDSVGVKIYDLINEDYLMLTPINSDLSLGTPTTEVVYDYDENWNQYRKMLKFTPLENTRKIRIEFNCKTDRIKGRCFIDAPMVEPYIKDEFPSIYKDGKYSTSAYQILNPPPADVDRFTPLEHFNVANSLADNNGQIYYQEMLRTDGSLAIKREALNPDLNGFYQTFVETFYKKDGTTVNYVDNYTYTYTDSGAILTKIKTTTEVI